MTICTSELFLKDVSRHELTVLRDDGLYRQLRFRKPESYDMGFDLVTWPGYLAYTGDMGCYVFQRLEDMFKFFRTDRDYAERQGVQLTINPDYWSEKLKAVDGNRRNGSATEYRQEKLKAMIKEQRLEWIRERDISKDLRRALWDELDGLLYDLYGEESHDYQLVNDWSWSPFGIGKHPIYSFEDLWEHNFHDYTFHFIWCCFALTWGIKKYDDAKDAAANKVAA